MTTAIGTTTAGPAAVARNRAGWPATVPCPRRALASHPPGSTDPAQLTFRYSENPDGWVTAQIVEYPQAISQGSSEHEAYLNVLEALHDLTHEPTVAERIAFATQAGIDALAAGLEPLGRRVIDALGTAVRGFGRDRVH